MKDPSYKDPSYIVKVTDRGSGESVCLKYPHPPSQVALENLERKLTDIARNNPEFTPFQVAFQAADRLNAQPMYTVRPIRAAETPWDYEVAYGEAKDEATRSQRFTFHVRCLADCVAEATFPQGGETVETATAYVKEHLGEFDRFFNPKIIKACEVVEGSGCLEDDYPPLAQVVCVDGTFTASPETAKCVKFSRPITDYEAAFFQVCLKEGSSSGPGYGNAFVVDCGIKLFNGISEQQGWGVTAEVLDHIEPWHRMIDHDLYNPYPGPSYCRLCGED